MFWSESSNASDSEQPQTPNTDITSSGVIDFDKVAEANVTRSGPQNHAKTTLITEDPTLLSEAAGDGEPGTQLIRKYCCGGGCCFFSASPPVAAGEGFTPLDLPQNPAFKSLNLKLTNLSQDTEFTNLVEYPERIVSFSPAPKDRKHSTTVFAAPPKFVQPHPPYDVFSAPLYHARELTKPGAEKRTFHFDIDVTDYPEESGVDFKVGGAVGVCPSNAPEGVEEIFDLLGVPKFLRDKPVQVDTKNTRWPTIWGDEASRQLTTTRRELLTWCSDIQSYPPTKQFFRVLADHATDPNEQKVLLFLSSAQGQAEFCELRTGPHLSLLQLLHAFPSARPPLDGLMSVLSQLQPRFYSLSNDPHVSSAREGLAGRRLIEIAVTVHESPSWRGRPITGVGSGFMERLALRFQEAERNGEPRPELYIPMFRGLMANPLSREFGVSDGPMMLIGAGVGMAPFRGFILNRLKNANCASKIWLVQGVRNADLDELYSGELGQYEQDIKRVVQSRKSNRSKNPIKKLADRLSQSAGHSASETNLMALQDGRNGSTSTVDTTSSVIEDHGIAKERWQEPQSESRYVQDELRQQSDVVWDIVRSVDGRIFVCGSSKGMGEGVEQALIDIVKEKGGMDDEAAKNFWKEAKEANKYVAEVW